MKEVIIKYKKLIWIWTIFNCTALLISIFNIYGDITENVSLFNRSNFGNKGFWPIVPFYGDLDQTYYPGMHNPYFNGIFYRYDITEFVFYMFVLIAFLTYKGFIAKKPVQHIAA